MTKAFEKFVSEISLILTQDDSPPGREAVRAKLEILLSDEHFISGYCGPEAKCGANLLFQHPSLGFQILSYIMEQPLDGGIHDHGSSWAIYGQAVKWTEMTDWLRTDDFSQSGKADLEIAKTYRLQPGMAGIFQNGAIHSIRYPGGSRFIRITGCNLSTIPRGRYDVRKGTVRIEQRPNFDGSENK
ncbi:MAG: hypothetical protein VW226_09245 [Rhodospirillaceae bacterium]